MLPPRIAVLTGILLTGIVVGAIALTGTTPFSFAADTQRDSISFVQVTDGAYSYDQLRDVFDTRYAGVHSDTAQIGDIHIDSSMYGRTSDGEGCFVNPQVTRNGQAVDDYNIDDSIDIYPSLSDRESTDNQEGTYGDLDAEFANPFYMDTQVYLGTFYGVSRCYGPMNRYELAVPFDQISNTVTVPDTAEADEQIAVEYRFSNQWTRLEADLEAEVCIGNQFCRTVSRENASVPVGQSTATVTFTPDASGQVTVDAIGQLGIDPDTYPVEDVAVDCNGDGTRQDPTTCDMITVADIRGGDVVRIRQPPAPVTFADLDATLLAWIDGVIDFFTPPEVTAQ